MTATYRVGELPTIVSRDAVVLTTPDRLAEVVALDGRDLEPLTVVEVLSRGSLGDLPDFVAARVVDGEVRVVVRGAFAVRTGDVAVDGRGVATWTELSIPLAGGAAVEVVPLAGPARPVGRADGMALPLAAGVVRSAGVTWTPSAPTAPAAPPVAGPAPAAVAAPADERTVVRQGSPPPAATIPPPPPLPALGGSGEAGRAGGADPDHDGRTITPAQLQALRGAPGRPGVVPPAAGRPARPGRPVVAVALSNGRVVPVRRRVLIGRSPRIQQVGGSANLPALITVDDPYVSSTHLEVAADGGRVTVTDHSTNGTLLARRGGVPVQLDAGVPTEVAVGDVLTLSRGLTATLVPAGEE
ncbi:FHA domain-containing protein [Nocardioides sp. SYSU DS0651]|uniref:FHA domain-containing protein n=1 Tax=Nocardioides sp. SYSU DS0651 TaxID=3415955 RepID=UPI003F4B9845